MRRFILITIAFLLFSQVSFAGDMPWWTIVIRDGVYGIGEISNRILLYLGDDYWITPLPAGKVYLGIYLAVFVGVGVVIAFIGNRCLGSSKRLQKGV